MITKLKDWVMARKSERTSWDGALLIAMGVVVLMGNPFVELAAWRRYCLGCIDTLEIRINS